MKTTIGQNIPRTTWPAAAMSLVAIVTIANDLRLSADWSSWPQRASAAVIVVFALLYLVRGDTRALGLCWPTGQTRYWLKAAGVLALALISIAIGGAMVLATEPDWLNAFPVPVTAPEDVAFRIVPLCVIAPLLEETLYRLILCVPIAIYSPKLAIVVSGAVFAGLHFVYANPGIDNFVAGYLLAWIYLKSGSIAVPMLFHAGGNAIILFFQVVDWYVLHG